MDETIKEKMRRICNEKIQQKGEGVQVSFYAFFANKNEDPKTLMAVARWWIEENQFNHFEKATKIRAMLRCVDFSASTAEKALPAGFNHLTFTVSDLDVSLDFYCHLLGFRGEVRWQKGAYLSYQDVWLCLSLGKPAPSADYSHVAISASHEEMRRIRKDPRFHPSMQWQENTSEGDSLYLLDPDGHKLELHQGSLATRLNALKHAPYDELIWLSERI